MKNYFVIISIMIIFLVPLNASAGTDEPLDNITDDSPNPYVSAYLTLHNRHSELVGAIHFDTILSNNNPVFSPPFTIPLSENLVIKEVCNTSMSTCVPAQYQVSVPIQTVSSVDADCNNAAQEQMGYGNIHDTCFFYVFTTDFIPLLTNKETGESLDMQLWNSLHHGYVAETGDTITVNWTILIPRN